jgi:hypothetical protein
MDLRLSKELAELTAIEELFLLFLLPSQAVAWNVQLVGGARIETADFALRHGRQTRISSNGGNTLIALPCLC